MGGSLLDTQQAAKVGQRRALEGALQALSAGAPATAVQEMLQRDGGGSGGGGLKLGSGKGKVGAPGQALSATSGSAGHRERSGNRGVACNSESSAAAAAAANAPPPPPATHLHQLPEGGFSPVAPATPPLIGGTGTGGASSGAAAPLAGAPHTLRASKPSLAALQDAPEPAAMGEGASGVTSPATSTAGFRAPLSAGGAPLRAGPAAAVIPLERSPSELTPAQAVRQSSPHPGP